MKFEELIREAYKRSKAGNLIGLMYSSGKTLGFKDFASEDDLEKAMNIKWDMLYLKSIPADTEIQIYENELKDFKVKASEETLYVLTTHGETRLIY